MKNIIIKFIFLIALINFAACDHFEELNKNPYSPTVEGNTSIGVANFLRDPILRFAEKNQSEAIDLFNPLMQTVTTPAGDADRYNVDFYTPMWSTCFGQLRNVEYVLTQTEEKRYLGMAKILKVLLLSQVTNLYGDIPYFEAVQGYEGILQPKYDSQKDIYADMILMLEDANLYLQEDTKDIEVDYLLKKEHLRWRKFANALKIRLLMMQSKQVNPSAKLQEMLADMETYPLIISNHDQIHYTVNAGAFSNAPDQTKAKKLVTTLADFMLKTGDERIKSIADTTEVYDPSLPNYVGIPSAYIGEIPGNSSISTISALIWDSGASVNKIQFIGYAEQLLMLAEAAEKGYINSAVSPQEYYEGGIEASYEFRSGIIRAGISAGKSPLDTMKTWSEVENVYLSHSDIEYEGTSEEKLEKIGRQMWIALYGHIDGWFHQRRTGYPVLKPGQDAQNYGKMPVRFNYPDNEKIFNTKNYKAALEFQGPDDLNTKMWLIK